MIVIDIAQREASRGLHPAPMISFRRTDADRRPARSFARPNDGPSPDREARSNVLRERLKRRSATTQSVEEKLSLADLFERNVRNTLLAVRAGNALLIDIAPLVGVGVDRTRTFCSEAVKRGLLTKTLVRRGNANYAHYTLTDAGRAHIGGAQP